MGHPKRPRKKYETPSHPWQEDRIKHENELMKKYGLKNKREIWKAQTLLRNYRNLARSLLARVGSEDEQYKKEVDQLITHLARMNILDVGASLDDVLALNEEHLLSRRLQTIVYLKGLASTPEQARQLIVHGHIAIGGRKVSVPSYMVRGDEEGEIDYAPDSPLVDVSHPARPPVDLLKSRKPVAVKSTEEDSEKSVSSESSESEKTPVEPVSPGSEGSSVESESSSTEVDVSSVDSVGQGGR